MKFRVVVSLLGFASLFAVAAQAQEERKTIDVFAGYSYVRDNPSTPRANSFSLNGGNASVAYNFKNWLSGVADFGGYHNTNILGSGGSDTLSTYLFGPRVSYRRFGRITPFGQVLFGGGVDYRLSSRFSIRPAQVEYLLTRFNEFTDPRAQSQNNLRVSTGIVFRF